MIDKTKGGFQMNAVYGKPEQSKLFVPWFDPDSGITSYILGEHYAPSQQAFYFTNANVTNDGKHMWFYASYPPTRSMIGSHRYGQTGGSYLSRDTVYLRVSLDRPDYWRCLLGDRCKSIR